MIYYIILYFIILYYTYLITFTVKKLSKKIEENMKYKEKDENKKN